MEQTLEQQLAEKENEAAAIRKAINERDNANKPKSIMDKINGYSDILNILEADKNKDVISIDKFSEEDINVIKNIIRKMRICKVYNGNRLPKRGEKRWYSYYNVSSGFVFDNASDGVTYAAASSASRLSFLDEKSLRDFNKKFQYIDEAIIDMQD